MPLRLILSDFYQTCNMYVLLHCTHVRAWWLKKTLKIGWKKSKEHITDFLEIMRFFSILWVTSLSGNPPEIYSGQIHPHEHYAKRANECVRKSMSSQRPLQEHQQLGPGSTWLCLRVSAPVSLLAEYRPRLRGYRDRRGGNGIYIEVGKWGSKQVQKQTKLRVRPSGQWWLTVILLKYLDNWKKDYQWMSH